MLLTRQLQLPDIVSSVALARDGYFNAAMANAIGSQVLKLKYDHYLCTRELLSKFVL